MENIKDLVALPEGRTLGFKRDLSSLQPILKTIVAFANTAGGVLLIGRDDSGNIFGVENVFEAEERLANAIADGVFPQLIPEIEATSIDGKSLLLVKVVHWPGPFYLKSKGVAGGVYIRLGSTNRMAGPEFLEEIERVRSKISFDQLPCLDTDITGLDIQKIEQLFSVVGQKISKNNLETLGVLVRHAGKLVCSNGGIILFGKKEIRERFFPNATVRCARFQGVSKVNFIDQYDVEGTILDAMVEVPKFIRRNTQMAAEIKEVYRQDIPEYSPVSVREVLTNALVHADYSVRGSNPRIAIFSDRLEVESPGALPFGFVLEDFYSGLSHVRNKVIARVFRELGLMEEWGTGYLRISEVSKDEGYETPTWKELGAAIRVVFPSRAFLADRVSEPYIEYDELSYRQRKIMRLLAEGGEFTAKDIGVLLKEDISRRTLRLDLHDLKKMGKLRTTGRGPSTRWRLV